MGTLLQLVEHVESPSSTDTPVLVVAVGDVLDFLENERGHDQLRGDDLCLGHVGDPPVDQGAAVQHQWPAPLEFARKLDVGDHEPKIVLGLQQERDADVAEDQRGEQLDEEHRVESRTGCIRGDVEGLELLTDRFESLDQQVAEQGTDEQPEVDRRKHFDPLALDQHIDQREQLGHGQQADPQQQGRVVREIESVLADVGRQRTGTDQEIQHSDDENQHAA